MNSKMEPHLTAALYKVPFHYSPLIFIPLCIQKVCSYPVKLYLIIFRFSIIKGVAWELPTSGIQSTMAVHS